MRRATVATTPRDLVLDGEHVLERAIIPFSPEMAPCGGVDQLRGDPNPITDPAHAALDNVVGNEHPADLPHVDVLVPEREGGVPGNDEKLTETGELGDDVLGDAIAEVDLVWAAHVGERQNCHGRPVGLKDCRAGWNADQSPLPLGCFD